MQRIIIDISADPKSLQPIIDKMKEIQVQDQKNSQQFQETEKKHSAALGDTGTEMGRLERRMQTLGERLIAVFAVERIYEFGKEAVIAFGEAEASAKKLEFSLNAVTGGGKVAFKGLIDQAEKLSKITFFTPAQYTAAQAQAAAFGLSADQIKRLLPQTANLAVLLGTDLAGAMDTQLRAIEGQTRGLKVVGQAFKATGDPAKNFELLLEKGAKSAGQAEAALNTTGGALKNLAKNWDIAKEKVGGFLVNLANGFPEANKATFESIEANQKAAKSSQSLLDEYNNLTKKGVIPTQEEKKRLTEITYQLRDALGESVVSIDKETGALVLNKDAVKEAIKQKLLLANQEASTLALQVQALKDSSQANRQAAKDAQDDIDSRVNTMKQLKLTAKDVDDYIKEVVSGQLGSKFTTQQKDFLKTITDLEDKRKDATTDANKADEQKAVLLEKLKKLGFDEIAVTKLFNEEAAKTGKASFEIDPAIAEKEKKRIEDILKKLIELRNKFNEDISKANIEAITNEEEKKIAQQNANFEKEKNTLSLQQDELKKILSDKKNKGNKEILDKANEDLKLSLVAEKKLEEGNQQAILNIKQEFAKKAADALNKLNKEQSDKDFKLTIARLQLQEAEELAAEEKAFNEKGDKSESAEEEHLKRVTAIKLYYLDLDTKYDEDNELKRLENKKKATQLTEEEEKKLTELQKKAKDERIELVKQYADFAIDEYNKVIDEQIANIDHLQTRQAENIQQQTTLAAAGKKNDLAFEEKKQADLEALRMRDQQKQKKEKELEILLNSIAAFSKEDPKSALQKALQQLAVVKGAEALFGEEGGIAGKNITQYRGQRHRSGREILIHAEMGEGLLTTREMTNLGGEGAFLQLKKSLSMPLTERAIPIAAVLHTNSYGKEIVKGLAQVNKSINDKPDIAVDWDGMSNMIVSTTRNGIKESIKYITPKVRL